MKRKIAFREYPFKRMNSENADNRSIFQIANLMSYYAKSFLGLLIKIKTLQKKPFKNAQLCFEIQVQLIAKIKHLEARIRHWKKNIKNVSNFEDKYNILFKIKRYQDTLHIFKTIGDCLAYVFIDRWDIKPLNVGHTSGFISGKTGFKEEFKVLKATAEKERICLLG
jgi:hypothetical protein